MSPRSRQSQSPIRGRSTFASLLLALLTLLVLVPLPASAAEGLSMEGRVLLQGHARVGSWMVIAVDFVNDGPAIAGELRLAGGSGGRSRFGRPVDLPTGSRKTYTLYAQPPSVGSKVEVALVNGDQTIASIEVAFARAEANQLFIGIVAEQPGRIAGEIDLPRDERLGRGPVIANLTAADLPERVEGLAPLDRLIWQDVDTTTLTTGQVAALRGWVAAGGRLVLVGGSTGPDVFAGLPDELLPYRPTATLDAAPETLGGLIGAIPANATILPVLSGEPGAGRALATSGDRVIAADLNFGHGSVTLLGFDPTTPWIADSDAASTPLWRRLLPARTTFATSSSDDSQITNAVANLPSLALPPVQGLLVLLLGYIILVGPVNYLVLSRLDRREWAWVTIPALITVFTVGAFGFGSLLRGNDVILHEVAIVKAALGTTDASGQTYLGVFSPTRTTYELKVTNGALLSPTMSGEFVNADATGPLDILQGDDSSTIRGLQVGFGSLRTVRAEGSVTAPLVEADLRLEDEMVLGTVRNLSSVTLQRPAVVLGASVGVLDDLAPGETANVSLRLDPNAFQFGGLADKIVGPIVWDPNGQLSEDSARRFVRQAIINQLTFDPMFGFSSALNADTAVIVAWGDAPILPVEISGQRTQRVANVLYQYAAPIRISGRTTFQSDLLRSTVLDTDALFFNKDPFSISFGNGSVRLSYRPIAFAGTFAPERVLLAMNFGGGFGGAEPTLLEPAPACGGDGEPECPADVPFPDGLPEVEFLDRTIGEFVPFPHLENGRTYRLADPARWVDPATGELEVRFVNERQDGVGFQFNLQLQGIVE